MTLRFVKWLAWSVIGWVAYRAITAPDEQTDEHAEPDGEAGGERAAEAGDDLTRVRGIGPGIAAVLEAAGITTWGQLAATDAAALQSILDEAGPRYLGHDPSTWPAQAAELAAAN